MTLAKEQGQSHGGKQATPRIECQITVNFDGQSLTGFALEDGTYQFLIGREMRSFDTLREVRNAWEAHVKVDERISGRQ